MAEMKSIVPNLSESAPNLVGRGLDFLSGLKPIVPNVGNLVTPTALDSLNPFNSPEEEEKRRLAAQQTSAQIAGAPVPSPVATPAALPQTLPAPTPVQAPAPSGLATEPQVRAPAQVPPGDTGGNTPPPSTYTETQTTTVSKDYNGYDKVYKDQLGEVERTRNAVVTIQENTPTTVSKAFGNYIGQMNTAEDALTGKLSERAKEAITEARSNIDRAQNDYIKFQNEAKVDPERYIKSMPSTERAVNSLLIFLEGMSAAKAMGKGAAVPPVGVFQAQLNKAIDQDIAFQKDELNRKGDAALSNVNRYKDNYNLLNNERAADLKSRAEALNVAAAILTARKGEWADEVVKKESILRAEEAKAAAAKAMMDANASIVTKVMTDKPLAAPKPALDAKEIGVMVDKEIGRHDDAMKPHVEQKNTSAKLRMNIKLAEKGNETAVGNLQGAVAQAAQGGGKLSDGDLIIFTMVQSLGSKAAMLASQKWSGTLPKSVLDDVAELADINEQVANYAIAKEVYNSMDRFAKQPGITPEIARNSFTKEQLQIMDKYMPMIKKAESVTQEELKANADKIKATRANLAAAGG
jgi:hypothetical protein